MKVTIRARTLGIEAGFDDDDDRVTRFGCWLELGLGIGIGFDYVMICYVEGSAHLVTRMVGSCGRVRGRGRGRLRREIEVRLAVGPQFIRVAYGLEDDGHARRGGHRFR